MDGRDRQVNTLRLAKLGIQVCERWTEEKMYGWMYGWAGRYRRMHERETP